MRAAARLGGYTCRKSDQRGRLKASADRVVGSRRRGIRRDKRHVDNAVGDAGPRAVSSSRSHA
eukprot:8090569-Pyramimonas_sp.AAC.1